MTHIVTMGVTCRASISYWGWVQEMYCCVCPLCVTYDVCHLFKAWLHLSNALLDDDHIALGLKNKPAARCAWVLEARASSVTLKQV